MKELTKIFNYDTQQVRTVLQNGEIWFVAADVCSVLDVVNVTHALKNLEFDERSSFKLGRQGTVNIVNEFGLYNLILGSRKPEAKKFKRWVTHEVLPSIRRTGSYGLPAKVDPDDQIREKKERLVGELKRRATAFLEVIEAYEHALRVDYGENRHLSRAPMTPNIGDTLYLISFRMNLDASDLTKLA
jgi:Prophage antirepressor